MSKKTFIRAVEYWVPSADGSLLECGGGLFGISRRFEAATRPLCFGRGEGLPGHAWESGRPIMLKALDGSYFRRAAVARAEGLTCAIALPIFVADQLRAVTVLFCGDDEDHAGAIELWRNQPEESTDMTLVDGYYGTTGDTFEFISRSTSFRRGTGLPGRTWERQAPVFLEDLGRGSGFLRAESAVKVGINQGFAIPCAALNGDHYVMAFLSALGTPIARRVDVFEPDAQRTQLRHSFGFAGTSAQVAAQAPVAPVVFDSPAGQVFATGTPAIERDTLLMPVAMQGRVTAVLALTL
jgi:hypothetical protein